MLRCYSYFYDTYAPKGFTRHLWSNGGRTFYFVYEAVILDNHLKGCVATAIQTHDNESRMISDVIEIFNKFSK